MAPLLSITPSSGPWRRKGPRGRASPAAAIACIGLWVAAVLVPGGGGSEFTYCSDSSSLTSRYLVPLYESRLDVTRGCISAEKGISGGVIHVLRANTTARNVLLTVTETGDSDSIVLVLQSASKIRWRLAFVRGDDVDGEDDAKAVGSAVKRSVALTPGSRVIDSNAEVVSTRTLDDGIPDEEGLVSWVRREYGAVSTFASVENANRISILLSSGAALPGTCELNAPNVLPDALVFETVTAYAVAKQPATGCYHPEVAGTESSDVHVVNLQSAGPAGAVYISMSPKRRGGRASSALIRNLTLVLRSAQPVKWFLQSQGLKGNLTVIADRLGDVQNLSLAPGQKLIVRYKEKFFPGEFESLWRVVMADTEGAMPVSYVRMARANIVSLSVTEKKRRLKKTKLPDVSNSSAPFPKRRSNADVEMNQASIYAPVDDGMAEKTVVIPGDVIDKAIDAQAEKAAVASMVRVLKSMMGKTCSQSETVVTLDASAASHYLIEGMTLNDPSCKAKKNETHWILTTQSATCGSLNVFSGSNPMFTNNVVLSFSPASRYYGRAPIEIPFSCRFKPGLGGGPADDTGDYDYDYGEGDDSGGRGSTTIGMNSVEEMYQMSLYKEDDVLIVERRGETGDVTLGDKISVHTSFETKAFLNLALETCWVSAHPDKEARPGRGDVVLVSEGCAVGPHVEITAGGMMDKPQFAFNVTQRMARLRNLYVFCLIGLCSPIQSMAGGNLNMCVDPKDHCRALISPTPSSSPLPRASPVAQQLTRRGPLFVHRLLNSYADYPEEPVAPTATSPSSTVHVPGGEYEDYSRFPVDGTEAHSSRPGLHSSHVVMVGVPAEIAVAIALASFVVGAALTGLLCCVHHRKAMPKMIQKSERRSDATDGSELQSMLNPCIGSTSSTAVPAEGGNGVAVRSDGGQAQREREAGEAPGNRTALLHEQC